jgi:hypothetical protein
LLSSISFFTSINLFLVFSSRTAQLGNCNQTNVFHLLEDILSTVIDDKPFTTPSRYLSSKAKIVFK